MLLNDKRIEIYHPKILTQCTFARQRGELIGAQQKIENIKNKMAFTKKLTNPLREVRAELWNYELLV